MAASRGQQARTAGHFTSHHSKAVLSGHWLPGRAPLSPVSYVRPFDMNISLSPEED